MVNKPLHAADVIEERLVDFAVRIIKLASGMPTTLAGKHIAGQILRSGTSPAPNYTEARSAESRADFKHKLSIVLKELNESLVWIRVIERSEMIPAERLVDLRQENLELAKIIGSSIKTARRNSL